MKFLGAILLTALAVGLPTRVLACATCFSGEIDSPMADGMNWAILTLGVVITTVLGAFLTFLIYAIRRSEALTAATEQNNSPSA